MKYLKLYEQFRLLLEATGKRCVLIDGTSSAGKSYISEGLTKKGWVIIGSDNFSDENATPPAKELRIPFDHAGEGYDKEAGEEFHKSIPKLRKDAPKEVISRGGTNIGWPGHPRHKDYKKVSKDRIRDPRTWYMYQDYLYGRGKDAKGVIFDDVQDTILEYVPNCEYILLYAPLERLKDNVIGRSQKNDKRGQWVFSEQFLKRFVATENIKESFDPEGYYTKEKLKEILSDPNLQKAFDGEPLDVDKFISDLGILEDGKQYWLKLRQPLKDGQRLFNSRGKTPEDLEKFIS
jgi:hypothetical protein